MTELFSKSRLYCPGPTPVGREATEAALNTNIYHRTDEFAAIVKRCREQLQPFFGTSELPILLSASGTGAMEAAVSNYTAAGDPVLCIVAGKFGERWQKIATSFDCKVDVLSTEFGRCPKADQVAERVFSNGKCYRAIFLQANETSTGVYLPIEQICKAIRKQFDGLIVVDAISALAAHEVKMDEWGIDVLLSGSQKGFGIPPGLAFIAASQRALAATSKRPRFYFDLAREAKNQAEGQTAWTPPTSLILALNAALGVMMSYGPERIFAHHQRLASAVQRAATALELELFAEQGHRSHALTSMRVPEGVNASAIIKSMQRADGVIFAGGQDHLKGKIIRMSHLGFVDRLDIIAGIGALEFGLQEAGLVKNLGAGLAAAMQSLS